MAARLKRLLQFVRKYKKVATSADFYRRVPLFPFYFNISYGYSQPEKSKNSTIPVLPCYYSRGGETYNWKLCNMPNLKKILSTLDGLFFGKLWISICKQKNSCISFQNLGWKRRISPICKPEAHFHVKTSHIIFTKTQSYPQSLFYTVCVILTECPLSPHRRWGERSKQ